MSKVAEAVVFRVVIEKMEYGVEFHISSWPKSQLGHHWFD